MKLYEITNEYRIISDLLDESEGEITPEIQARMDAIEGQLEGKVDAVCGLIREAEAERDSLDDEAARLKDRAASAERQAKRLRAWLFESLNAAGVDRVKTPRFTAYRAKCGVPSVSYDGDPAGLPAGLRRVKYELNRSAILDAVKSGGTLPAGFTVAYTEYLGLR